VVRAQQSLNMEECYFGEIFNSLGGHCYDLALASIDYKLGYGSK